MNYNSEISQENIVKLLLINILEKNSLSDVINDIISITKKDQNNIVLKDKIPLTTSDLLSIIYHTIGSIKLLKWLIEVSADFENKNRKKKKKTHKIIKKERKLKSPKFLCLNISGDKKGENIKIEEEIKKEENISEDNNIKIEGEIKNEEDKKEENTLKIEEEVNNEENKSDYTFYSGGSNPINVNDIGKLDDFVIEIKSGNEILNSNVNNNSNLISLDEEESSNSQINNINSGLKTEIKLQKQRNRLHKKLEKENIQNRNGIKSETKLTKIKKDKSIDKEKKLSYHYRRENDKIYKYKISESYEKENKAKFVCAEPDCKSYAEYDINKKIFRVAIGHSVMYTKHCYVANPTASDNEMYKKMDNENCNDIQLVIEK